MLKQIRPALMMIVAMTLIAGIAYPLGMTGLAQVLFPHQAGGSLIAVDGRLVGSELIGQGFSAAKYFHGRPSAAGNGYDAANSSGSNLGPTSKKFINGTTKTISMNDQPNTDVVDFDGVKLRVISYCDANGIAYQLLQDGQPVDPKTYKNDKGEYDSVKLITAFNDEKNPLTVKPTSLVPGDAVTGSGSGLDPHISPKNALLQAPRVAKERNLSVDVVNDEIDKATAKPQFGILGEAGVNVLTLNLALDRLGVPR